MTERSGSRGADLVVIVPGITGSVLARPDGTPIWQRSLRTIIKGAVRPSAALAALRLDDPADPGLVPTGLINGWHLWPGVHAGAGYHGVVSRLTARDPEAVRVFPYDWRLSNRYTARLLGERVRAWLEQWRERSGDPDARAVFVCHSMGGLIVRYLLEVLDGRDLARTVITLGTPYSGAVKAVAALTGDAFAAIPRYDEAITDVARSFPSLYELLPTYNCVEDADGVGPVGPSTVDLDPAACSAGAEFHAELAAAVRRNGPAPYALHVVVGKRHDTLQSVHVDAAGRRTYRRSQRGTDHSGDGTVATFAAVPPEWKDNTAAALVAARHGGMTTETAALETLAEKLWPIDLGAVLLPDIELGIGLPDIADPLAGVPVTASANREDLLLHATVTDPDGGEPVAEVPVRPIGDGRYETHLTVPPGQWRVTVTAVAEATPVSTGDLVWVVDG